ncbi:ABC transporter ATP-binding protein [Niabella beijingensis]|uniref:ABC transporter ATP-binding protein n=1 Tax=Niabella beijingensis TaxID=2872700 RepID=UPI001CBAA61C|nr:ATP-binding cassette domain-containing protein [Niabella beijingensis]MBZ4191637.1 ATP-binding cassette domain-containing protein [Niabella beijingensis]
MRIHTQIEQDLPEALPVLIVRHLYKSFGENQVLVDFNLELKKGESVVVLGRSGSGKSVLIKCIIGLLKPDQGDVVLLDVRVPDATGESLDQLRAKVGFLFQSNALYDSMTVRENLEFPLRRHWMRLTHQQVNERVLEALNDVGLAHTIEMMPEELSGGMRKRIALARTLILKPEVILYDEPTTGLDPITGREIIGLMMDMQKKYNTTSLIISHDMNCVKIAGKRIVILIDGKCYADGNYETFCRSNDVRIKQFFE